MLSLSEIFKINNKDERVDKECYTMQKRDLDGEDQLILLVDRMDLIFND